MKAHTIKQFELMQFIKSRFEVDEISIKSINDKEIMIEDRTGESIVLFIEDGIVKWRDK